MNPPLCEARDTIPTNGLHIDFDTNVDGKVDQVTFRLNESWQAVLSRASQQR